MMHINQPQFYLFQNNFASLTSPKWVLFRLK